MLRTIRAVILAFLFLGMPAVLFVAAVPSTRFAQAGASRGEDRAHLVLLGTTDLHGHIEPLDYWTNRPANLGLAKIATLIGQARAEQPNVLLLDSGDAIEGTPLASYFDVKDTSKPNPMILAMNSLGYDAMAVGNHEFNFGLDVLLKAKREAHFPMLAANVRSACRECENYFAPYIVKQVGGVRVAIVGFVTPVIPSWEEAEHYKGYTFEPIVEAASRVIPEARRNADVVVAIAHSGLGADPVAGTPAPVNDIPGENMMNELAEQVPGIDVILFGHTHEDLEGKTLNGALLVQAKNWGGSLARVDLDLAKNAQRRWEVAQKKSSLVHVTEETTADPGMLQLAAPYERATQAYLDKPVATTAKELDGAYGRYQDDPLVDLIHKVQLENGHADVSLATIFLTTLRIPPGPVTIRQIAALYLYENELYTVEMTGAQLRQALEHAASFYSAWPVPAGEKMQLPDYYADSAEGVNYTIDLTRPTGDRIVDLRFHGAPLDPAQKLRVAMNNYRATGGGKYDYKDLPVVYRSSQGIRDLIIEYVTRTGAIPTEVDHNWRIVPQAAVDEMIRLTETPTGAASVGPKPAAGLREGPEFVSGVLQRRPAASGGYAARRNLLPKRAEMRESY